MEILNRLERLWKRSSRDVGIRRRVDSLTALLGDYEGLKRLARQIRAHAEMAPYAYVNQRLNQIALEKEESASRLKEKILYLGGEVEEKVLDVFVGNNHWVRLEQDIKDQRALEDRLVADVIFVQQESHEISDLLSQIAEREAAHREAFQDLQAKADPQASTT